MEYLSVFNAEIYLLGLKIFCEQGVPCIINVSFVGQIIFLKSTLHYLPNLCQLSRTGISVPWLLASVKTCQLPLCSC